MCNLLEPLHLLHSCCQDTNLKLFVQCSGAWYFVNARVLQFFSHYLLLTIRRDANCQKRNEFSKSRMYGRGILSKFYASLYLKNFYMLAKKSFEPLCPHFKLTTISCLCLLPFKLCQLLKAHFFTYLLEGSFLFGAGASAFLEHHWLFQSGPYFIFLVIFTLKEDTRCPLLLTIY